MPPSAAAPASLDARGAPGPPLTTSLPRPLQYANAGTVKHLLLKEMVSPRKRLFSQTDALRWSLQIAQALAYLHSHNPMVSGGGRRRA